MKNWMSNPQLAALRARDALAEEALKSTDSAVRADAERRGVGADEVRSWIQSAMESRHVGDADQPGELKSDRRDFLGTKAVQKIRAHVAAREVGTVIPLANAAAISPPKEDTDQSEES